MHRFEVSREAPRRTPRYWGSWVTVCDKMDTDFIDSVRLKTKNASIHYTTTGTGANISLKECRLHVTFTSVKTRTQVADMFPGCALSDANDLVESTLAALDQQTVDLLTTLRTSRVDPQDAGAGAPVSSNEVSSLPLMYLASVDTQDAGDGAPVATNEVSSLPLIPL